MKSFIIISSGNSSKSNEKSNPNTSVLSIQFSPKRSTGILPNLDESNKYLCIQEKESNKSKLTFDEPTKVVN